MPDEAVVRLRSVSKSYKLGDVSVRALTDISLDIARGEFVALAGPSGSGKTTLLNLIGCIDKPDSGEVILGGANVTGIPLHRLSLLRLNTLGFIFQTFNLVPVLTAYENVEYPLLMKSMSKRERHERVVRWLEKVDIMDQAKQRPDQLSGGQRQRVAIARAMAGDPKLVLADEPTANLDSETAAHILDLLAEINAATMTTFVFSTHDRSLIARAKRLLRIRDGRIAATAAVREEEEVLA